MYLVISAYVVLDLVRECLLTSAWVTPRRTLVYGRVLFPEDEVLL